MKNVFLISSALSLLCLCFTGAASAQQMEVSVEEITVTLMPTPEYNYEGESKRLPKAKDWIEVEVEFKVEGKNETGFLDQLEFTYYVMMDDNKTMLVESVTHINIPLEEEIFSDMFISPTTLKKLFGREVTSDSAVAGVAIEVRYQGALIAGDATVSASSKWWQGKQQTRGELLKKSETPYAPLWWDRYADVKQSN